jgi:hypothetical protein
MAANYEEILKLIVDAGESVNTIEGLKKRIDELKKEMATMTIGGQDYVATKQKVDQLSKAQSELSTQSIQTSNSIKTASREVKGFGDAATVSGGAAIALGQLFSDIGQFGFGFANGIRAIANNISQLATLFAVMVAQVGGLGKAFKLLWASMKGPLGIVVAIQAVVGVLDLWASSQRKAKEETDKTTESINEEVFAINAMYDAYQKMNPSTDEARKLKKRLSEQLKVNVEDYKTLGEAVAAHIKLMDLMATATEVARMQKEELAKQLVINQKLEEVGNQITAEKDRLEKGNNRTLQSGLGIRKDLGVSGGLLNQLEEQRNQLIKEVNNSTNYRLQLEQKQAKLQEEINKFTKEGNEEDEKKKKRLEKENKAYFDLNEELQEYLDKLNDLEKQLSDDIAKKDRELYIDSLSEEQQEIAKVVEEYKELIKVAEEIAIMKGVGVMYSETSEIYKRQEEEINRIRKKYADKRAEQEKEDARKRRAEQLKQVNRQLDDEEDASKRALDRIHQTEQAKLQAASNTFGFLIAMNQAFAGKTEAEQRKAFQRDKALRVAQATIDTYAAANAALASGGGTPLGFAMMAAAIAAGMANVTTILAQQFNGGSSSAPSANGGIQGGYPYPMSGFSTIDPQFPDRTGSLNIIPRTQRIVVLESDITGAQKTSIDREQKAKVG